MTLRYFVVFLIAATSMYDNRFGLVGPLYSSGNSTLVHQILDFSAECKSTQKWYQGFMVCFTGHQNRFARKDRSDNHVSYFLFF